MQVKEALAELVPLFSVTNLMPGEACENGLLFRIIPVDVSEYGHPVSISYVRTIRKRQVGVMQDVIGSSSIGPAR